jgi:hypothetical protein
LRGVAALGVGGADHRRRGNCARPWCKNGGSWFENRPAGQGTRSCHLGQTGGARILSAGLGTGVGLPDVMRQTLHKLPEVALTYLRPADLWRNNATQRLIRER